MRPKVSSGRVPQYALDWLASSRLGFLEDLGKGKPMRYFSAHLPVMATWREGERFPVNMTVKGLGLIPWERDLQDHTNTLEGVIAEARTMPWHESLPRRIEAASRTYRSSGNFDPCLLGGLEIFEGRAYENLLENPMTSLLYVGMADSPEGMRYISFQVNGEVEILDRDNDYYRYLLAARKLFEFDKFHLYQPDYPFGYLIRVTEVRDKSPWSKPRHGGNGPYNSTQD
ncbi:MAG: hypothetical protein PVJ36_01975 [Nitrospirota bacterium]|jgi:hypothetical protein